MKNKVLYILIKNYVIFASNRFHGDNFIYIFDVPNREATRKAK